MLITGLNGSLAPRLAQAAQLRGFKVTGWNREQVPPEDETLSLTWLSRLRPRAIFHLAMGSEAWAAQLAKYASHAGIPFVFTSSAMVFDHEPNGPHKVTDERSARDDYGRYKIRCEDAVRHANNQAMVVRIGWQIDPELKGNNMLCALDEWQQREGCVAASRAWCPACSFMQDTAAALLDLVDQPSPGVLHLDSNAHEGHSFAQIVHALRDRFGRTHWQVREHDDYVHDQRLAGGDERMPGLSTGWAAEPSAASTSPMGATPERLSIDRD